MVASDWHELMVGLYRGAWCSYPLGLYPR